MPPAPLRTLLSGLLPMATRTTLGNGLARAVLDPPLPAALATASALPILALTRKRDDVGKVELAHIISLELDHIEIGATETSHFVDAINKKVDQDVHPRTTPQAPPCQPPKIY